MGEIATLSLMETRMLFRLSHGMGNVNSMLLLPVISSVQKGHDGMRVCRVIVVVAYQPEETFWGLR